jgi:hypothetical protein
VTCAGVNTTANLTAVGSIRLTGTSSSSLIQLYSNLTTTGGSSSEIRLKTVSRFLLDTSDKLVTAGGDVVVWTGYDKVAGTNKSATAIYLNTGSAIETSGGKIWLAGGLDDGGDDASITSSRGKWSTVVADDGLPDGYAVGRNTNDYWSVGVLLEDNVSLKSSGGDIFIAGAMGPTSGSWLGHVLTERGTVIDSGTGRIAMWGRALSGTNSDNQGIALHHAGDGGATGMISSDASSSDAISIYSDSRAAPSCSRGITAYWWGPNLSGWRQGVQILATRAGGGISLTGLASSTSGCNGEVWGVNLEFVDVLAKSGPITINAISNGDSGDGGLSMGLRNNLVNQVRFGAWATGRYGTSGS